MNKYVDILVFSNPVEGREADYNRWYDDVHLAEVVASSPAFKSATRYRLSGNPPGRHAYLAIYYAHTDDPAALMAELSAKTSAGEVRMSDAIDLDSVEIRFAEQLSCAPEPSRTRSASDQA